MRTAEYLDLKNEYPNLAEQFTSDFKPRAGVVANPQVKEGAIVFSQEDYNGLPINRSKDGVYLLKNSTEYGKITLIPIKRGSEKLNDMDLSEFMESGFHEGHNLRIAYLPEMGDYDVLFYRRVI